MMIADAVVFVGPRFRTRSPTRRVSKHNYRGRVGLELSSESFAEIMYRQE